MKRWVSWVRFGGLMGELSRRETAIHPPHPNQTLMHYVPARQVAQNGRKNELGDQVHPGKRQSLGFGADELGEHACIPHQRVQRKQGKNRHVRDPEERPIPPKPHGAPHLGKKIVVPLEHGHLHGTRRPKTAPRHAGIDLPDGRGHEEGPKEAPQEDGQGLQGLVLAELLVPGLDQLGQHAEEKGHGDSPFQGPDDEHGPRVLGVQERQPGIAHDEVGEAPAGVHGRGRQRHHALAGHGGKHHVQQGVQADDAVEEGLCAQGLGHRVRPAQAGPARPQDVGAAAGAGMVQKQAWDAGLSLARTHGARESGWLFLLEAAHFPRSPLLAWARGGLLFCCGFCVWKYEEV